MIKEEEIQNIVTKIAQEYEPEKIILFGSFAWGKPTKDSDVDLLIIKNTEQSFFERNRTIRKIINGFLPVDILVKTPKEVEKRLILGDFFYKNIINKGKEIYDRSK